MTESPLKAPLSNITTLKVRASRYEFRAQLGAQWMDARCQMLVLDEWNGGGKGGL